MGVTKKKQNIVMVMKVGGYDALLEPADTQLISVIDDVGGQHDSVLSADNLDAGGGVCCNEKGPVITP